jgi:predicted site-specific integrase-resolvase
MARSKPESSLDKLAGSLRLSTMSARFDIPPSSLRRDVKDGPLRTFADARGIQRAKESDIEKYLTSRGERSLKGVAAQKHREVAE